MELLETKQRSAVKNAKRKVKRTVKAKRKVVTITSYWVESLLLVVLNAELFEISDIDMWGWRFSEIANEIFNGVAKEESRIGSANSEAAREVL